MRTGARLSAWTFSPAAGSATRIGADSIRVRRTVKDVTGSHGLPRRP
jgi:hypothetical protein